MIPETQHERVVVIGGGFGGINVAKGLSHSPASVVLVDRRNFHLFQPLLYQVATAELEPSNIAAPLRQIFADQKNVDIALGDITSINLDQKTVEFDGGECSYDYLVIAMGMRQSYYGHDEYKQFAPGLKSIDDALEVRRRILLPLKRLNGRRAKRPVVRNLPLLSSLAAVPGVSNLPVQSRTLPRKRYIENSTAFNRQLPESSSLTVANVWCRRCPKTYLRRSTMCSIEWESIFVWIVA